MRLEIGVAATVFTLASVASVIPLAVLGSSIFGIATAFVGLPIYWLSRKICHIEEHYRRDASSSHLMARIASLVLTWLAISFIAIPFSWGFIGPRLTFRSSLAVAALGVIAIDYLVESGNKGVDSLLF